MARTQNLKTSNFKINNFQISKISNWRRETQDCWPISYIHPLNGPKQSGFAIINSNETTLKVKLSEEALLYPLSLHFTSVSLSRQPSGQPTCSKSPPKRPSFKFFVSPNLNTTFPSQQAYESFTLPSSTSTKVFLHISFARLFKNFEI